MQGRFSIMAIVASLAAVFAAGHRLLPHMAVPDKPAHLVPTKAHTPDDASTMQTTEVRGLQQQVDAARSRAANHGNYACCIEPGCSWCMLHMGKCTCVLELGSGKGACRECHGGWEAGQGRLPGKTKQDVRKMKTLWLNAGSRNHPSDNQASHAGDMGTAPTGATPSAADAQAAEAGRKLFDGNGCRTCHAMNGEGGAMGPDLTHEAQRHADGAWQIAHLKDPAKMSPGSTMPSFARLGDDDLKALAAFLATRK